MTVGTTACAPYLARIWRDSDRCHSWLANVWDWTFVPLPPCGEQPWEQPSNLDGQPSCIDEPPFTVRATGIAASMAYYPWARAIVLRASADGRCSVRAVERGLYKLSQKVPSEAGRGWDAYGRELQVAITHAERTADGDDGGEEA